MKNSVSILLLISLVLTLGNFSFAKENTHNDYFSIEPKALGPCALFGTHRMQPTNLWAEVFKDYDDGNRFPYLFGVYKCECGEVVVCSGVPHLSSREIGEYWIGTQGYILLGGVAIQGSKVGGAGTIKLDATQEPNHAQYYLERFSF